MSKMIISTIGFPNLDGQEIGRELELEITAIVTRTIPLLGSGSHVELEIVRVDITQTT